MTMAQLYTYYGLDAQVTIRGLMRVISGCGGEGDLGGGVMMTRDDRAEGAAIY